MILRIDCISSTILGDYYFTMVDLTYRGLILFQIICLYATGLPVLILQSYSKPQTRPFASVCVLGVQTHTNLHVNKVGQLTSCKWGCK